MRSEYAVFDFRSALMDGNGLQINWLVRALVLLMAVSGGEWAMADSPPDHSTTDENREAVSDDPLRRSAPPDVEPTRPPRRDQLQDRVGAPASRVDVDPAVLGVPPGEPAPRLRREGEFIVNQRGRVIRPEGMSEWFFLPTARDDQTRQLPPMIIQPSGRLEMIETFLQDRDRDAAFEVSGRVHTYRGVNYLLLTRARPYTAPSTPAADEQVPTPEADEHAAEADPVLEELLSVRQPAPSPLPRHSAEQGAAAISSAAAALGGSAPGARNNTLHEEGNLIMQRRGRVTRSRDGAHVIFSFQADGRESPDPPMIILPSQLLESMENIIQQRGNQVVFIVSGQVYTYQGATYLLPTMMRLTTDRGNLK